MPDRTEVQVRQPNAQRRQKGKVILSTFLGNTIEWYDFYIYGIAASLYFPTIFFGSNNELVGTIASFAALAGGFLIRPIGGIIGGHIGDKFGRKRVLVGSMVLMGIATFIIGVLPSYETIGVAATLLLILARLAQGLGAGAEWGGGTIMVVEHMSDRWRGFWGSLGNTGVYTGAILATLTFSVISRFPADQQEWIWRIPFIAAAALVLVGLWIRLGVEESPHFVKAAQEETTTKQLPLVATFSTHLKQLFIVIAIAAGLNVAYQLYITYGTAYTKLIEGDISLLLNWQALVGVIAIVLTPLFGWLSDLIGRRLVTGFGLIFMAPWVFVFFHQLSAGNMKAAMVALVLCEIGHSAIYGPLGAYFSELFDTKTRYTGASIGYQVGGAIAGLAPLVAATLLAAAGGPPNVGLVPLIVVLTSSVALVAVLITPKRKDRALPA